MSNRATILLVEDDPAILEGMTDLLHLFGLDYEISVHTATNGAEGLAVMQKQMPDLIISDIMMPRMNGFEFLAAVRENPRWIHIPFIFLTAKGKREEILQGRRSGVELYITKPFVSDELLELVKTQLDRAFALRALRERKLKTLQRDILQVLNHEFRTPLTYVTAYYEMLADSVVDFADATLLHEYLRGIQVGSTRLNKLVEDLIQIMAIRTGEAQEIFEQEAEVIDDLAFVLAQRVRTLRPVAEQKGVTVESSIPEQLPPVFGAPPFLNDILERLLDNALKFTALQERREKRVHVGAKQEEGFVRIWIEDTGIGFPPSIAPLLFDLFFQHDRETQEQQGSGAGLAIVKGYVEMHQGRVEVESQVGKGSCFAVLLPVHTPALHEPVRSGTARRLANVLLVEDDPHLLEGLKELLELSDGPYQLQVRAASNGQEGLEQLSDRQPDLIISDVMMPVMGGYEFLSKTRANPAWMQIPFIFLTAKGERGDIHRGLRSGAELYITKPYDIDELLALATAQLDRHFQRQGALSQSFENLKRGILSMLRPDIKDPLHMVTTYSEKLAAGLEGAETEADLISSLQGIRASSQHLAGLVEDFIAMAEYKTGEAQAAYELRVRRLENVGVILYEAAYERIYDQNEYHVQFEFDLQQNLPPVRGDQELLLSMFGRLLDLLLSMCVTEPPATLHLSSRSGERMVSLRLAVSKSLLKETEKEQIAAFLSSDEEALEMPLYGPGITVVKSAVSVHKGDIELEPDNENDFTLHIGLPIWVDEA